MEIQDLTFKKYISKEDIKARVKELATQIDSEYSGKKPLFLGILNGSFMFAADLFKHITIPSEISFLKVNSYVNTDSSGNLKELIGLNQDIAGRNVLIIEDIVDTGRTLDFLIKTIKEKKPASLKIITLLHKPQATVISNQIDFVGFEIENKFVVGYGLDYNGLGRNIPEIMIKS